MMFVEESPMEGNEGLPLIVGKYFARGRSFSDDLNTFLFDHDEATVDALNLIDELLSGDGPRVRLQQHGGVFL